MIAQDSSRLAAQGDPRGSRCGIRTLQARAKSISCHASLLALAAVVSILAPSYLLTAAPGLTWANHGADGGELATAVATWGVPHPTGYPTYVLLGRLFLSVPGRDPAYGLTLMSVMSMAAAAGILGALAAQRTEGSRGLKSACGVIVGLAFGLGPISWAQATIVEVHGLHTLFVALALLLIGRIETMSGPTRWSGVGLACLSGLALGNHITFALLLPAVVVALWRRHKQAGPRWATSWIMAFGIGLSVYLYLPFASRAQPALDWGDPSTWEGFSWVISGGPYRGLVFGYPLAEIPARIAAWAHLLRSQFGLIGLGLGILGLNFGKSDHPWIDRVAVWIFAVFSVFALSYNSPDSSVYLIPAYVGFAWWIGRGLGFLATSGRKVRRELAVAVPIGAMIAIGLRVPSTWREVDASSDRGAIEYAEAVMTAAPERALILTQGDRDSFPLWYMHHALGLRPDLRLVVAPLMAFDWYRQNLAHTYPDLELTEAAPSRAADWLDELLKLDRRPVCRARLQPNPEALPVGIQCES